MSGGGGGGLSGPTTPAGTARPGLDQGLGWGGFLLNPHTGTRTQPQQGISSRPLAVRSQEAMKAAGWIKQGSFNSIGLNGRNLKVDGEGSLNPRTARVRGSAKLEPPGISS